MCAHLFPVHSQDAPSNHLGSEEQYHPPALRLSRHYVEGVVVVVRVHTTANVIPHDLIKSVSDNIRLSLVVCDVCRARM